MNCHGKCGADSQGCTCLREDCCYWLVIIHAFEAVARKDRRKGRKLLEGSIPWQSSKIKDVLLLRLCTLKACFWQSLWKGHLQIQLYVLCMVFAWYVQLDASNCQLPMCLKAGTKRTRKASEFVALSAWTPYVLQNGSIEAPFGKSRVHRIPQNLVQFQKRCVTSKVEDAIWCNDIVENLEISIVGHIQGKNAWLLCVVYMLDEFIWANIEKLCFHFSIGRGIVRNIM